MGSLNQQSLITIVNQSNGNKPADGIPGDRHSVLGNPFDMNRNERLRDPVCDAYKQYFKAVLAGSEPVPVASELAQELGLTLASAWQRPDRNTFMRALAVLEKRQADGKPSKIMCWCAPKPCHLDTVKAYLDNQRTQFRFAETTFRTMPEAPARTQQPTLENRSDRMNTDIANSIQLIGQLSQPMLDALTARLETTRGSLNADVSNYARGRLNTWIGVQWDLKNKQFIPADFWDAQLWEFGQRVYPGAQMLLLTYSGDGEGAGTGIGLHRDDSYAKFEARTVSVETQGTESTWFMRQTYPGMGYVNVQNEAAGVHEFGLPSGSVITFNCKNQHAVEPGKGRWSLNLWQVSDKHQTAYKDFVETYGQSGGIASHQPANRDLILPKPLHITAAQRQQLQPPTVRQVWSVADFNNRPKGLKTATRGGRESVNKAKTETSTSPAATENSEEPAVQSYQWSRYAPAGTQGYECSTQGDRRFSALYAKLLDGRTLEEAYQLDVKGYRVQGDDWRLGKGKPPLQPMPLEALYNQYKTLWQLWATENPELMCTLAVLAKGKVLTDKFASTVISQARALAELLNETNHVGPAIVPEALTTKGVETMTHQPTFAQTKPYNPLQDLAPLNARVKGPMQKDIAMGEAATQFIGRSAASAHTLSSTRNYEQECTKLGRSNTGVYSSTDVVMVSGSGPWRGVTHAQIQQTFQQHYEPLLEAIVTAKAVILVGNAQGTDQLVQQWLRAKGYRLSPESGYMRVEPPLAKDKHHTTAEVQSMTTQPSSLTVISGGQTGADFGGLKAAKALGLAIGGTAPHGWLVERCDRFLNGTNPGLAAYGLVEGPHGNSMGHTYILRTELNVQNSDGTLVLGNIDPAQDKGSYRTVELAEKHGKPCLHISTTDLFSHSNESVMRIKDWVLEEGLETLNVAGNRESNCPGLEDRVETVLKVTLAEIVKARTELEVKQQTTTNRDHMTIDSTTPIVIACDGACSGNPGPGGYGTIVQYPDGTEEVIVGNALETTNNRMELQGLIAGLQAVYSNSEAALTFSQNPVHVLTDSELTIKCAEGTWKRKANRDLWQEYDQLPTSRALTFEWVRGHNGHELNERCDTLAVGQSQLAKQGKVSEPAPVVQPDAKSPQSEPQSQSQSQLGAPKRYPVYLSLTNNQLQQHDTWSECQAVTSGVSGAKFKKVKDKFEQTKTLEQWGVSLPEPTPARCLIYADRECCPQSDSTDVQTQTSLLTQKAIKEAQKRGYTHIEVIVATLNDDPVNRECLQPLVAAAQAGVSKTQLSSEIEGSTPFQADVYESPDASLDLLDLQGNPDSRLILISNGKGLGTQQLVQQAESLEVKVIGYNPEKQTYIGVSQPQPVPVTTRKAKGTRGNAR